MNKSRLIISVIAGAILGVFCIVGAQTRFNGELSTAFLFGFWFNRLLMGIVFGLIASPKNYTNGIIRGLLLGLLISFSFYVATEYKDLLGFLVGGVYGVIIEVVAFKFEKRVE